MLLNNQYSVFKLENATKKNCMGVVIDKLKSGLA